MTSESNEKEIELMVKDYEKNEKVMKRRLGYAVDEFDLKDCLKPSKNFVEEMMKLIETKIVRNREADLYYRNKYRVKDSDDDKPYFKYTPSSGEMNSKKKLVGQKANKCERGSAFSLARSSSLSSVNASNKGILRKPALKGKSVSMDEAGQVRKARHIKFKAKGDDETDSSTLRQRKPAAILPAVHLTGYPDSVTDLLKRYKFDDSRRILNQCVDEMKSKFANLIILQRSTPSPSNLYEKRIRFNYLSPAYCKKYIDLHYDSNIARKSGEFDLISNEKFPESAEITKQYEDMFVNMKQVDLKNKMTSNDHKDSHRDHELDEFLRFEYYSSISSGNEKEICQIKPPVSSNQSARRLFIAFLILLVFVLAICNSILVFSSFIDKTNISNYFDDRIDHNFDVKFPLHNIEKS